MKKVLVTGGAGFIGSNLVDTLLEKGLSVVVVDNLYSGKKSYLNEKAKFCELDICDEKGLSDLFEKENFDTVFHLAAQIDVRHSVENPLFDARVNVLGAVNVLENCRKYDVNKIVFSSSAAIYGEPDEVPTTENAVAKPLSPYGVSKYAFEKYLYYYWKTFSQKYTALRFSNVFGPRQFKGGEAGVISIFIDNYAQGKKSLIFGDGHQRRDFIFVMDIVDALIVAGESEFIGVLNASTSEETSLLEVVEMIEKVTGEEFQKEFKPAKAGDPMRSVLANDRIKSELNWCSKTELVEGVKKTIEWTKVNKS